MRPVGGSGAIWSDVTPTSDPQLPGTGLSWVPSDRRRSSRCGSRRGPSPAAETGRPRNRLISAVRRRRSMSRRHRSAALRPHGLAEGDPGLFPMLSPSGCSPHGHGGGVLPTWPSHPMLFNGHPLGLRPWYPSTVLISFV